MHLTNLTKDKYPIICIITALTEQLINIYLKTLGTRNNEKTDALV